MPKTSRENAVKLEDLPNIGKACAADLKLIGIHTPQQLVGKDPVQLYENLCEATNARHDPCVLDTFMSAVRFMEGAQALPWWAYTAERKAMKINEKMKVKK
ncbi:helix-hairpin-helix domain-containing protein [Undibacterium sp.]|uniref:helix-hairpin-helix domain-containing protein n=1 Tax=Undibacterium sp. TaxID=1914977 RepID=UPI00374DFB3F